MVQRELLRKTVADFFGVPIDRVEPSFRLNGSRMQSSLARHVLDAAIRRELGAHCPAVYTAKTYGELATALCGGHVDSPSPSKQPFTGLRETVDAASQHLGPQPTALSCGIDVESVEKMPSASDYWDHEFYQANFTDAEIAYCVSQEQPAVHFAARWCAKEALKKCQPQYLALEMRCIEVARAGDGRPFLRVTQDDTSQPVSAALSMTHGPDLAMAVVVCGGNSLSEGRRIGVRTSSPSQPATIEVETAVPTRGSSLMGRMAVLLSLISVVLAVIALLRSF